ncbi:hypothetical protein MMC26_005283 [Xylographa opegraphella]|nr:hypothetical protein [Xylographa opegraphella]
MAATLPPFPRFIFAVLEPISLIAGWVAAYFDPVNFIADQIPSSSSEYAVPSSQSAQVVAMQLGNTYMLLALLGLFILNTTMDSHVVKVYIIALAVADIGHVAPTMCMLGWERSIAVQSWNKMAWGNIGATIFLFVTRVTYLLGLFGKDRAERKGKIL